MFFRQVVDSIEWRVRDYVGANGNRCDWTNEQGGLVIEDSTNEVDNLIGIRGIMSIKPGMLRDLYTLTESVEDGWWYSAFVPSGQLVIYFFTDADIAKDKGYLSIEGWTSGLQKKHFIPNFALVFV